MNKKNEFNEKNAIAGIKMFLEAFDLDLKSDGLEGTPKRIVNAYKEFLSGDPALNKEILATEFVEEYEDMVNVIDIPFISICEHHFLPFWGKAHVSYLPKGKVVGLSKIARLVDNVAKQPQIQERMTRQIAQILQTALETDGVAVVVKAEHSCLSFRGIKKTGTQLITSSMKGNFRNDAKTRSEFMSMISLK
jgi:GTP cyclohydrolase I